MPLVRGRERSVDLSPPDGTDTFPIHGHIVWPVWQVELDFSGIHASEESSDGFREVGYFIWVVVGNGIDGSRPGGPVGNCQHTPDAGVVIGIVPVENLLVDNCGGACSAGDHYFVGMAEVAPIWIGVPVHGKVRSGNDLER